MGRARWEHCEERQVKFYSRETYIRAAALRKKEKFWRRRDTPGLCLPIEKLRCRRIPHKLSIQRVCQTKRRIKGRVTGKSGNTGGRISVTTSYGTDIV